MHKILVGKGNISGSSGQFLDFIDNSGNLGQMDDCVENLHIKTEDKNKEEKEKKTDTVKTKTSVIEVTKTQERKLLKSKQKTSDIEVTKTPEKKT